MKILVISNLYPPHFIGGYEIACKDTVDLLTSSGHDCIVLTSVFVTDRSSKEDNGKVDRSLELHDNWTIGKGRLSFSKTYNHNFKKMDELLKEYKPDIVYFWNLYGLTLSPVVATKNANIPYVVHLMDLSLKGYQKTVRNTLSYFLGRTDVKGVDLSKYFTNVISISSYVKANFCDIGHKFHKVIHPFLDLSDTFPQKINYSKDRVFKGVFIGQIEVHKGVVLLCEAIHKINKKGIFEIELDIYGRSFSNLDEDLKNKFNSFITIYNNKERKEIVNSLADYDVGFFPSIWEEPFGIAQIELMGAGLPILASARGGSKEALTSDNSITYTYNESEDLVDKLEGLLRNYSKDASSIGRKARQSIETNFSKKKYIKTIEKELFNLIKNT
jgi:glycogen synthase